MIEFIILVGTMVTPACPAPPCYTKMEVQKYEHFHGECEMDLKMGLNGEMYKPVVGFQGSYIYHVLSSTPIARCEVEKCVPTFPSSGVIEMRFVDHDWSKEPEVKPITYTFPMGKLLLPEIKYDGITGEYYMVVPPPEKKP